MEGNLAKKIDFVGNNQEPGDQIDQLHHKYPEINRIEEICRSSFVKKNKLIIDKLVIAEKKMIFKRILDDLHQLILKAGVPPEESFAISIRLGQIMTPSPFGELILDFILKEIASEAQE